MHFKFRWISLIINNNWHLQTGLSSKNKIVSSKLLRSKLLIRLNFHRTAQETVVLLLNPDELPIIAPLINISFSVGCNGSE